MPVNFIAEPSNQAVPVHLVKNGDLDSVKLDAAAGEWVRTTGYKGEEGQLLLLPGEGGRIAGALFGVSGEPQAIRTLVLGSLAKKLPEGRYRLAGEMGEPELAALALKLGGYSFTRYGKKQTGNLEFELPEGAEAKHVEDLSSATFLTRDLINTPASDMGPEALEAAAAKLAEQHGARFTTVKGEALLEQNFPMIHAVGALRMKHRA